MRATSRLATADTRALDLNDIARDDGFLFVRDGVGVAGRGVAARVPFDEAPALLAGIDHDDATSLGVTPVGIGWVPFVPGEAGEVVVPRGGRRQVGERRVLGDARRRRWHDPAGEQLAPDRPPLPGADSYRIEQVTPPATYLAAVDAAREAVRAGRLTKAVIAREIAVVASRPFDRHGILHRLKAAFGSSYRFAVDGFFGASPELLVAVDGNVVTVSSPRRHGAARRRPRT